MRSHFGHRAPLTAALAALLVVSAGCASKGSITGKVTYKGKPMPGGYVIFVGADGKGNPAATINPKDGSYTLDNVPTGVMTVAVQSIPREQQNTAGPPIGMGMPKGMPGGPSPLAKLATPPKNVLPEGVDLKMFDRSSNGSKPVVIPAKYTKPETSGLTVTVKGKMTEYDIDIP